MSLARQFLREMRPLFRLLEDPVGRLPATYAGIPSNGLSRMTDFDNLIARPAIDVSDMGDKFVVEADLPGVSKENLDIRIGDNRQSIIIEGRVTERGGGTKAAPKAEVEQESAKASGEINGKFYVLLKLYAVLIINRWGSQRLGLARVFNYAARRRTSFYPQRVVQSLCLVTPARGSQQSHRASEPWRADGCSQ